LLNLLSSVAKRTQEFDDALKRRRQATASAEKLQANGGQALYVHAKERDKTKWDAICNDLVNAGFGVFPAEPERENIELTELSRVDNAIAEMLSVCDGLLIVAGEDPNSLQADLLRTGRNRRNLARSRGNQLLPCAVVDDGLRVENKNRLQASARNLGIGWIEAQTGYWSESIRGWLHSASGSLA
jgi:hypothetical protein